MSATEVLSSAAAQDWLAIALTPGLGPTKARRIVEFFGGASAVLRAPLTELECWNSSRLGTVPCDRQVS